MEIWMYLATYTRPELAYAVGQLSRFVEYPTKHHVGCVVRVLLYRASIPIYGILYKRTQQKKLVL